MLKLSATFKNTVSASSAALPKPNAVLAALASPRSLGCCQLVKLNPVACKAAVPNPKLVLAVVTLLGWKC